MTLQSDERQAKGINALISISQTVVVKEPPPVPAKGRHRKPNELQQVAAEHGKRLTSFSVIGLFIFALGLALQAFLVEAWHIAAFLAYVIQGVASIQMSFLLNYYWTWRDKEVALWSAWRRFNAQKAVMTVLNFALYAGLIRFGVNYLLANALLVAVFTVINYLLGHFWAFVPSKLDSPNITVQHAPAFSIIPARQLTVTSVRQPTVSVVIPCKGNEKTIRATVESLLGQSYPGLEEVILVGSVGDTTWQSLEGVNDPRLVILEQEPTPGRRDPNVKRDKGIRKARGELLALSDSDIVMPPGWLSHAVETLISGGGGCVAGGMKSIHDSFWGRYVDTNRLGAKTPRVPVSYLVTRDNFGKRGKKPPITANVVFTRQVYENCPLDVTWAYGYEDYEWFWRIAKAGHRIFYSSGIAGWHHHRRSLRMLGREYLRASQGCGRFIRAHWDSPLARKRLRQAIALPLTLLGAGVLVSGSFVTGHGLYAVAGLGAVIVCAVSMEYAHSRTAESLVYPFISGVLALTFALGLLRDVARRSDFVSVAQPSSVSDSKAGRAPGRTRSSLRNSMLFGLVLAGGAALRFWQLGSKPGWQYDEATYYRIAQNVALNGTLNEHIHYGTAWTPFLFQPPFYALLLARWFDLTGSGIPQARLLGVILSLVMFILLYRLIWRLHGPGKALLTLLIVILDGWLLFVQRVSYMENALMVIIVGGLLLYRRALEQPSYARFLLAGLVIGSATIFKQTGAYVLLAVALQWLIVRRESRNHLVLMTAAFAVVVTYIVIMIWLFDFDDHEWFIQQSLIQLERTVGLRSSGGGTLTSPLKFLHLISSEYAVFTPSVLAALAGFVLLLRRAVLCLRERSWSPLGNNTLLFSWSTAGVLVFGASSLKYPQYFVLILIPLYCYLWTELRWASWPRMISVGVVVTILLAGLGSFWLRVLSRDDNAFAQVQHYAATRISPGDLVVTEEPLGDLILQNWCPVEEPAPCISAASYAITWQTYLQSSFTQGGPAFRQIMVGAKPIKSFTGFNGTAIVWELRR
jgi:4-amino-4-deoxy-L-arabinose transferase-like glycosyltransferase/putative flippase GtrA